LDYNQTYKYLSDDGIEANKWMGVIIRGIQELKTKVIDNAPHRAIAKELDDLTLICENSFE